MIIDPKNPQQYETLRGRLMILKRLIDYLLFCIEEHANREPYLIEDKALLDAQFFGILSRVESEAEEIRKHTDQGF